MAQQNARSALAAIENPLAPPDEKAGPETLLFCLTDNANFYLQRRVSGSEDPGLSITIPSGTLAKSCAFGALRYNNLVEAYSLLNGEIDKKTNVQSYSLYAISPYLRFLNTSTVFTVIAACGDGKDNGWIYYLDNKDSPQLYELQLNGAKIAGVSSERPLATSYLAACYDPNLNQRYIFYQSVVGNGPTQVINCLQRGDSDTTLVVDSSKGNIKKGNSPLACCVIPVNPESDGENLVVLYYTSVGGALRRATYDPAAGTWEQGNEKRMSKVPVVDHASQITAVRDKTLNKIRVFFAAKDSPKSGFTLWEDDFSHGDES